MTLELTDQEAELLRDFVLDELNSIKDEELDGGVAPDMAEVNDLLDLAGRLGDKTIWADFDAPPADESSEPT